MGMRSWLPLTHIHGHSRQLKAVAMAPGDRVALSQGNQTLCG